MPYIDKKLRKEYDDFVDLLSKKVRTLSEQDARTPCGDLNYIISTLIEKTYGEYGDCYSDFNEKIGILECAKLELYRRRVAPYEDKKVEVNGDVYDDSEGSDQ